MNEIIDAENREDLLDQLPCGFISFLSDGTIVRVNSTLLEWVGLADKSHLLGKRFLSLIPVGERIFFETHFSPLLKMQGFAEEINFSLVAVDKSRLPVLTSTVRAKTGPASTSVYRMILFSILDRKRYETQLMLERTRAEAAAKAKAEFLSILAHEIRTPLNAVIGVSNLLEGTELSEEQKSFTSMLKASSDNLMNLLNNILDLSKIESGKAKLESRPIDIKLFADGLIRGWQGLAIQKGIRVRLNIPERLPEIILGDPIKLTQIFSNLLGNAIKFTNDGFVALNIFVKSVTADQVALRFEIEDTGIGISAKDVSRIFEEFAQADYETQASFGGTGLGLSICQKLVELHGSRIEVASELGKGSSFSFDVNFKIGEQVSSDSSNPVSDGHALKGLRVLIADDSLDNLNLMGHFFKKWGVEFETARNGKEALEKLNVRPFDVALMDLRMPIMNGYEATLAIKNLSDHGPRSVPVIAFSGSSTFGERKTSEMTIFADTIEKPFRPAELVTKLQKFLRR